VVQAQEVQVQVQDQDPVAFLSICIQLAGMKAQERCNSRHTSCLE
jgi:hypothetical protein